MTNDITTLLGAIEARTQASVHDVKALRDDIVNSKLTTTQAFDQFIAMLQTLKKSVLDEYDDLDKRAASIATALDGQGSSGNVERFTNAKRLTSRAAQ